MGITFGTPSDAEVLQMAIDKRLRGRGGALPGTVVSFDALKNTCSVDIGVHRLVPSIDDEDVDEVEELPTLQNVPVCWPVGRGIKVKATLESGDPVLLVCMDRDIAAWRRTGKPSEPDDARSGSWQSAVAVPGLVPNVNPFTDPNDAAALASKLDILVGIIKGWIPVPGPTTDGGLALKTAVLAYFPTVPAKLVAPSGPGDITTGPTTGSSVLLLEEPSLLP